MSNDHILPTGTRLKNGEYEILAKLGQGGFGITYRAEQTVLGRTVAVKEFYLDGRCVRAADGASIRSQSLSEGDFEAYKSRFYEEAKLLARFGDLPGIVNVIDFFRENNTVYYVMDFVQGPTLDRYLLFQPQERMAPAEAAELVRKVAVSLAPVHALNVLHRDLKPANIILRPNGEPVVLDFGAARAFISENTMKDSVIVTPGYAPPEQYIASKIFGPTIDIYALGAVLYRLLTGKTPPPSPGRIAEDMPSPHQLNPAVPQGLSDVVMKAMAQKAAERYGSVDELAKELETWARGDIPLFVKLETIQRTEPPTLKHHEQSTKRKSTPPPTEIEKELTKVQFNVVRLSLILVLLITSILVVYLLIRVKSSFDETSKEKAKKPQKSDLVNFRSYAEQVKGISFNMIAVPGGTFTMGCTNEQGGNCEVDQLPVQRTTLSDFYICETEVTQSLWKAIMGNNPSKFVGCDNCPVEQVSWQDAQIFIERLNQLTQKKYCLPTEAEWEFAARGGNLSKSYRFSGSNQPLQIAWFWDNAVKKTHPVKSKNPNELGIYDLTGNVWEWCSDWHGKYTAEHKTNPLNTTPSNGRVLRGGSWGNYASHCRVSLRRQYPADYRYHLLGFRLACKSISVQ